MYIVKRDGRQEPLHFGKISARLKKLCYGLSAEYCDPVLVARKVCDALYDGVTTTQVDELAAETAAAMIADHPDYVLLAARIAVSNLHKNTRKSFSETAKEIHSHYNERSGLKAPLADDVYEIIMKNAARLDSEIIYDQDYNYDYYGFKTLGRSYLLKTEGKVVERPQHMLMRVSVGIHKDDIEAAIRTYHLISQPWFCHASPTLFNAGNPRPLVSNAHTSKKEDDIKGIVDTQDNNADSSKSAGFISECVHNICSTRNPDYYDQPELDALEVPNPDTYTWHINNISVRRSLTSPVFTVKGYAWKLHLYPQRDSGEGLGIFLSPNESSIYKNAQLATKFEICLKNQLESKDMKKSAYVGFSDVRSLGFPAFLPLAEFNDPLAGFKVNDSAIIQVTFQAVVLVGGSVSLVCSI